MSLVVARLSQDVLARNGLIQIVMWRCEVLELAIKACHFEHHPDGFLVALCSKQRLGNQILEKMQLLGLCVL
jgi:hypothetical protein